MIVSFRHQGLRKYFETGTLAGIQPHHESHLKYLLAALDSAELVEHIDRPGRHFHQLKGTKPQRWAVNVNANWRLTFEFKQGKAYAVDYQDYHQWKCTIPLPLVNLLNGGILMPIK
ncbi:Killer protein [Duganella sp. FT50W]|uniref:Killer protein n=1 Tax=Duganella lactea TaxID=2692173 RepID=A0A6L8MCX3_9BURK|nr:type II toxin-antitoxin system RelE/ParE family toxin [Duganella lactea]MYM80453.1 Killer protein [Duganella lactea]